MVIGAVTRKQLSGEERRTYADGARAEKARRSFAEFCRQSWHVLDQSTPLEWTWHHEVICHHVQQMLEDWIQKKRNPGFVQRARNILFNLPPGTLKSRIISVMANAWMWLRWPSWTVLCLSANPDVAGRDALLCRDLVTSDWYTRSFQVPWVIRDDVDAKQKFANSMGGVRTSRGLTTKVTGNRADCILVDDPNDAFEVFGEASRREVKGKWDSAIYNRVNDPRASIRIGIQQRVHADDWSAHWLKKGAKPGPNFVVHVNLPMEFSIERATRETVFGRCDPRNDNGECLDSERFPEEFLAAERERLGTFSYEAQYNQNPGEVEGEVFLRKYWRFFRLPGQNNRTSTRPLGCFQGDSIELKYNPKTAKLDVDWFTITVDATFGSLEEGASQVGLQAIAGKGADRFIFDDRSKKMTLIETCAAIDLMIRDYPQATKILVEKKANGAAIIELFRSRYTGFIAIEPEGGKRARAHAMSPAIESGNVFLMDGATWVLDFVDELALFPHGKMDDRVDALSQLMIYSAANLNIAEKWAAMA